MDLEGLLLGALALAAGGVLKGVTGTGAPMFVVPVLALLYDVPFAVAIFSVPNIMSNLFQAWRNRGNLGAPRFWATFAAGGFAGTALGSILLARLGADTLVIVVAVFVLAYIAFRLSRPAWSLPREKGEPLAGPVGVVAGMLFGMIGMSSPVSLSYLNAMRLPRPEFVATISLFFLAMGFSQVPLLWWLGILDAQRLGLSCLAVLPILAAMPLGAWIARFMSPAVFDKVILAVLGVVSVRMLMGVL